MIDLPTLALIVFLVVAVAALVGWISVMVQEYRRRKAIREFLHACAKVTAHRNASLQMPKPRAPVIKLKRGKWDGPNAA